MSAKADKIAKQYAAELDRREAECMRIDDKNRRGETLTKDERDVLTRWEAEGRKPWREDGHVIARLRKAARLAAKNDGKQKWRKHGRRKHR